MQAKKQNNGKTTQYDRHAKENSVKHAKRGKKQESAQNGAKRQGRHVKRARKQGGTRIGAKDDVGHAKLCQNRASAQNGAKDKAGTQNGAKTRAGTQNGAKSSEIKPRKSRANANARKRLEAVKGEVEQRMCENRRCPGPHRVGVKTYKGEGEQTEGLPLLCDRFPLNRSTICLARCPKLAMRSDRGKGERKSH